MGAGVAFQITDWFTVASDIVWLSYSDLSVPYTTLSEEIRVDDGYEFHAGGEAVFFGVSIPIALRAGFFHEPDHDLFPTVDTELSHITLGGGIVLHQNFQVDPAVSISDQLTEGVMSCVVRF